MNKTITDVPTIQLRNRALSVPLKLHVCKDEETCPTELPVTAVSSFSVFFWRTSMSLYNCEPVHPVRITVHIMFVFVKFHLEADHRRF